MIALRKAENDEDLRAVATLADIIWHEHFTPIIGIDQVEYMLDKFQSFAAIKNAVEKEGYIYYMAFDGKLEEGGLVGYTGIKPEEDGVFLSKIYVRADRRRQGIAKALIGLVSHEYSAKKYMYLTVNRHNDMAVKSYKALGFSLVREQTSDIGGGFVMDDFVFKIEMAKYIRLLKDGREN